MERWYDVPGNIDDYVYVSQLLQAEGMRMAMEAHRREMPYSMGTLYWQLNDCWPVVSWSGLDYYGNKKALHYAAKRAFEDILIAVDREGDQMEVYLVSDDHKTINADLVLQIMDMEGNIKFEQKQKAKLKYGTSQIAMKFNISEILKKKIQRIYSYLLN